MPTSPSTSSAADDELARFHAGDRDALADCYRDEVEAVRRAVARVLTHGADCDTVVHEVFYRLIASRELRESFRGGARRAWLVTVARNLAIDHRRRFAREALTASPEALLEAQPDPGPARDDAGAVYARRWIDEFRARALPAQWAPVFEARFLRQLSQRDAARSLGMRRTTLAYQELMIRRRLRRFLLGTEGAP